MPDFFLYLLPSRIVKYVIYIYDISIPALPAAPAFLLPSYIVYYVIYIYDNHLRCEFTALPATPALLPYLLPSPPLLCSMLYIYI